jgi:hypothetical protein
LLIPIQILLLVVDRENNGWSTEIEHCIFFFRWYFMTEVKVRIHHGSVLLQYSGEVGQRSAGSRRGGTEKSCGGTEKRWNREGQRSAGFTLYVFCLS